MPELPEVEVVRRVLKDKLTNKIVRKVDVFYQNIIGDGELINNVENNKILDIKRRGKWLIFVFNDYYMMSHLRMEGKWFIKDFEPKEKHEHVIFYFDDFTLRYHDTRKFGRIHLIKKEDYDDFFKNLGMDANNLAFNYLKNKFKTQKNKDLKEVLLDQSVISGIGNIYADEICLRIGRVPNTKIKDLNDKDLENIVKYSKEILDKSIEFGGTTIRSYTSSLGVIGHNQDNLIVHRQEYCKNCHTKIVKSKVAGRTTYTCPVCQK